MSIDTIWFTRCPVPTATGLAYKLGWLDEEFAADGIAIKTLQETGGELARHHYDHGLTTLVREGGNLLALPARAQGADTRLVGLTWIDEWQTILVRPGSGIRSPRDLQGKRLALPVFRRDDLEWNRRGRSIARGMSLAGYHGALASVGLGLGDVILEEVGSPEATPPDAAPGASLWQGIAALVRGDVDAVYVKGAAAVEAARAAGVEVGIDLDALPQRRHRVNNGTPRPITVHRDFLERQFDLLTRFLAQTLRAADWAARHRDEVRAILQQETQAGGDAVAAAYRDGFHTALAPDLSEERLALFEQQKNFQLVHGFLDRDVDVRAWADARPLAAARALLDSREQLAA
ncbi:ABC transporter substrate-binding protein [Massilia arenae]|uniref:ABC transporter substrate-binding protein n=1 Tax=Massilia arenae TaxID=2603288 RepID=A0A5C7G0M5_9BURK|nr:ABC transporter substrate-binding protein [Massilia arenae]TXF96724.1 ABC transporter substrate-binding protein [Massilia arenae]